MLKKIIAVSIIAGIFLSGCSFFLTDIMLARGIVSGRIKLGMSIAEISKATGGPSFGCVKTRQTTEARFEMWDFATRFCGSNLATGYALVFKNNKLVEIRTVQNIRDLDW